jgi:transposase
MGRPYSQDLRERVDAAVEEDGLSRRKAAARFAKIEKFWQGFNREPAFTKKTGLDSSGRQLGTNSTRRFC